MHRWYPLALVALLPLAGRANESTEAKKPAAHASVEMGRKVHTDAKADNTDEKEIQDNLAKLSPEDRKLAAAQKYCPDPNEPLGSMGAPIKVMVKDQPVFVCCKGCSKSVKDNADETLAKVEELKKKAAAEAQK